MRNLSLIIMIISVFALGLSSCKTDGKNSSNNQNEVTIGVLAPLSGNYARYGEAMKQGIDIAIDDINSTSKIKLKTSYQDTKGQGNAAISGFRYLSDIDKVQMILGPGLSGISQTVAPFGEKSKVVCMSSVATADTLKYAGDYYFRNVPPNSYQAKIIADYLSKKAGAKKVGIFYENNAFGNNMEQVFKKNFQSNGGQVAYSISYDKNQTDFTNEIDKANNNGVDYLFIPGTTKGFALITRQLRERKIDTPIISGDGAYGDELSSIAGKAANGVIYTKMAVQDKTTASYKTFSDKYKKLYNKEPDVYALYSYDAAHIYHSCIEKLSAPYTSDKIKQCLYDSNFTGLAGKYDFDEYGEVDMPFLLYQYNDGTSSRVE